MVFKLPRCSGLEIYLEMSEYRSKKDIIPLCFLLSMSMMLSVIFCDPGSSLLVTHLFLKNLIHYFFAIGQAVEPLFHKNNRYNSTFTDHQQQQ
jgi:hypothetical protein